MSRTETRRPLFALWLIAAGVIAVDQLTKIIAVSVLEGRPRVPVLGDLAGFAFLRNPGAAFGLGSNTTWLFTLIAAGVFIAIVVLSRRLRSAAWGIGFGLLLGGLTGNLIDRLWRIPADGSAFVFGHGAVVDFIDLYFFVCNVADIAISAAAVWIVWLTLRGIGFDGTRDDRPAEAEREAV